MFLESQLMSSVWTCLVIAIASGTISITITQTELFAPLRALMQKAGHMIGYLFQCFYCMKHWIVGIFVLIYQPVLVQSHLCLIDLIVSWFFTVTISTFVSGLVFKVFLLAMDSHMKTQQLMANMALKEDGEK